RHAACATPTHTHSLSFFLHCPAISPISPLSLHDALPIFMGIVTLGLLNTFNAAFSVKDELRLFALKRDPAALFTRLIQRFVEVIDRKSTRLNSSHVKISYAAFCLKTKNRARRQLRDTSAA